MSFFPCGAERRAVPFSKPQRPFGFRALRGPEVGRCGEGRRPTGEVNTGAAELVEAEGEAVAQDDEIRAGLEAAIGHMDEYLKERASRSKRPLNRNARWS